ncbi:MAG TPA: alpha/beta hydrolase [Flavisolibacter sp.]|jgi:pimeloyl-ACP methyl ester carboxylesterase|nr:alpha/beta hydrolase [Flavisolibacter sp.]
MQEKQITHKHKKIFYRTIGEGPVVVLLHGVPFDGSLWSSQFNAFPDHKLIIPDLPGSGRSEVIDDMTVEGMAECVKDIIVHETASLFFKSGEPHSVIVIGHSMGGYITLALAEKHPELLNGFGLFHSTSFADSEERKEGRKKTIELLKQKGTVEFVKKSLPNLFSPVSKEQNSKLIEEQISIASNFSADALIAYQSAMMQRKDRREVLANTTVPVLFVFGIHDNVVPLKDGLEQSALAHNSLVHVLKKSGHTGMEEEPEKTNEILLEYLSLEKAAHSF